jgi:PAS domain S-box-containing protein
MGDLSAQWQSFLRGLAPDGTVRPLILDSWGRSRAAGVDPDPARLVPRRVPDGELARRQAAQAALLEVAWPHLEWLSAIHARVPHVASLLDRDGVVLSTTGADLEELRALGLVPGCDWSETAMGTNGAGTALAVLAPVFVDGPEHFARALRGIAGTGAPVRGPGGAVLGAVALTTLDAAPARGAPEERLHERLRVVAHAAYAVGQELRTRDSLRRTSGHLESERRHAAESLHESEQRFQGAFGHAPIGMALTNPDGRWARVNRALCEILGYAEEELVGRTFQSLTHPDDLSRNMDILGQAIAGEIDRCRMEKRLIHKRGHAVWVALTAAIVRDAAGTPLYFVAQFQDVTESKRAEAAVRESEARYRSLVETAYEGVWAVDRVGTTTYVNPRLCRMLGHDAAELLGRPMFDFMPADAAFEARTLFARRQRGIAELHDLTFRRRDGGELFALVATSPLADGDGEFAGVLAMITDISARKRAEAALRESEERFRALIENAVDLVSIIDGAGVFRYVSPAHERTLGYAPEALLGTTAIDAVHPEDLEAVAAAFQRLAGQPGAEERVEFRFRHRDGRWRTLAGVGRNFLHHPAVRGVVVNASDVTERSELEAQLRQAQKMEAVGQLAGGVAHDFNNLLTVIKMHAQLAREELVAGQQLYVDVEEIRKAADRAAALTQQLLAFSRKQLLQPRVLDLNAVVAGLEPMLRRLIGVDIRVETRLAPDVGRVVADPGQLEQVLMNLAVNARDAMADGGAITIETANAVLGEQDRERQSGAAPGAYVMLAVSDTGCGMSPEVQARIFEPFYTTKAPGKGTGLGLSTVYGIVAQSGGHISVDSAPGRGTTFRVLLPRDGDPVPGRVTFDRAAIPAGGGETVLLVEDDAAVRSAVRRMLTRNGYRVLTAQNGEEALSIWHAHQAGGPDASAPPIELVLTDAMMPVLGGRALAERLRAERPDAKVILMTGYTPDAAGAQAALAVGEVSAFLQKPISQETLLRRLNEVLHGGRDTRRGR